MKYTTVSAYYNGRQSLSKIEYKTISEARKKAIRILETKKGISNVLIVKYSMKRKDGILEDRSPVGYVIPGILTKSKESVWLYNTWEKGTPLVLNENGTLRKEKKR